MYEDSVATEAAREAAAREVEPVYSIDNSINAEIIGDLGNFFLALDEGSAKLTAPSGTEVSERTDESATPASSSETVDAETLESRTIDSLIRQLDEALHIQRSYIQPVTADDIRALLGMDGSVRDRIHEVVDRSIRERIIDRIDESDLAEALDDLRDAVLSKAEEAALGAEEANLAALVAGHFMRSNAMLDLRATEAARQKAREATPAVQKQVRPGEIFLRAGEVVTQEDLDILGALGMMTQKRGGKTWATIALFTLVLTIAYVLGVAYFSGLGTAKLEELRYHVLFYTILTLSYLTSFFLVQQLTFAAEGSPGRLDLILASLPVVAAAVLLTHYFTRIIAATISGFLAVTVTLAAGEPAILLPAVFPSLAATLIVKRDCPRPLLIRAIVLLPLIWVVCVFAEGYTAGIDLSDILSNPWFLVAGLAPAPAAMILANFVLDAAFNIATSNRLREFDTPDHPLLRRLQLEAPGTWHHSVMISLIAEAACQAVGGNTLLVRVGSMYHDVGKLRRPEFFVENQQSGINVHEKYSPWLSRIIVENHVKDGIALARAHGLPEEIIDMIPQHHGTALITYFFRKALAMSENGYVSEYEYRYPGPKPQTLEAACINMVDACESAVRSVDEPTPHRIEAAVQRIYEDRLLDGQYDECGLTLKQLETIKETVMDRLVAAYHARIEYPEEEELRRQLQLKRAESEKSPSRVEPVTNEEE
jgi:hypothetical protein